MRVEVDKPVAIEWVRKPLAVCAHGSQARPTHAGLRNKRLMRAHALLDCYLANLRPFTDARPIVPPARAGAQLGRFATSNDHENPTEQQGTDEAPTDLAARVRHD